MRTIAKGALSGITQREETVITNRAEWQRWWSRHAATTKTPAPLPELDFTKEMGIAVTLGRQRTGGYAIEIVKVACGADELIVSIQRKSPPPNSMTLQALTAPFHVVAVPRRSLKPRFVDAAK